MYYKCCVENCASRRQDVKLHKFPASEIGLQKWLECINSDRLRNLSIREVRKLFVCHKHFQVKFITEKSRIRLGAYPTLFSQEEIQSGVPNVTHEAENLSVNVAFDHCYYDKRLRRETHEDHTYSKPSTSAAPPVEQRPVVPEILRPQLPTVSGLPVEPLPVLQESQNWPQVSAMPDTPNRKRPALREIQNLPQAPTVTDLTIGSRHRAAKPRGRARRAKRRRRLVRRVADLPEECRCIYEEYKKSVKQLDFKKRAERAQEFKESELFDKLTSKVNPITRKIMWIQISQSEKKIKGRRFSDEEKMIALSLYKQSPKAYRFLRKIFILPSRNTLIHLTSSLNVQPGINRQIFDAVKDQVKNWSEAKKYCSIIFDEVSLEPGVEYDKAKDHIDGFVHLKIKKPQFADHALAFMIRGAVHKWQQPIAYYFCEGATKTDELKVILKDIINAVIDTGLLPVALISDQGQSFQSALKGLTKDTQRERDETGDIITVRGHNINIIFDPPHLIKGIRNNFLTKDLKFEGKICKWSDIIEVYKMDLNNAVARYLPKVNDTHVIPGKINKMKVKNCTQVLSYSMSKALSHTAMFPTYPDLREVSSMTVNTAAAVLFFDKLFDSTNGASPSNKYTRGKFLRKAVTENSPHHAFWRDAIEKFENIKFIDEKRGEVSVPTLKNWITTLKSYMRLWQFFGSKNIKIMRPRYFNSDPIEKFFGQVRAYNFRNNDPNCHNFISTFKSLLITRFLRFHSAGFNCEETSGNQLLSIKKLFEGKQYSQPETTNSPPNPSIDVEEQCSIQERARRERMSVHSRAYTAGWVVRKVMQKIKCRDCMADLTTEEGSIHQWISQKEYDSVKNNKLTYPSEYAVRHFGNIVKETNKYLETKPHANNITSEIKTHILSKYLFVFMNCQIHKNIIAEYFLLVTIKFAVFNWCNKVNKILKGTEISHLSQNLPAMQQKALDKYKKKFKYKKSSAS